MRLWTFLRQCVCLPHFRNVNTFASKVVMKVPGYSRFSRRGRMDRIHRDLQKEVYFKEKSHLVMEAGTFYGVSSQSTTAGSSVQAWKPKIQDKCSRLEDREKIQLPPSFVSCGPWQVGWCPLTLLISFRNIFTDKPGNLLYSHESSRINMQNSGHKLWVIVMFSQGFSHWDC